MTDGDDPERFWAIVQGVGFFETADDGKTWTPRNRGLRADWPREHDEIGFCVHRLVRSPVDGDRMYQQNHVGMHRSDDGGAVLDGDHRGPAERVRLRAPPRTRTTADTFYVIPLDPLHSRTMPDGAGRRLAHARRRLELAEARRTACRSRTRTSASSAPR